MTRIAICIALVLIPVLITGISHRQGETEQNTRQEDEVMLPEPITAGEISIEEAMLHRRSVRRYSKEAITLNDLSQYRCNHEPYPENPLILHILHHFSYRKQIQL